MSKAERTTDVNIGNMMKQAQKMQAQMAQVQEDLKGEVLEASAGGGTVRVTITGDMQVKQVTIDPQALDPDDVDMLQDMVAAAVNEAIRSAQELAAQRMSAITGGMNLPGLM
jgi:DNA-binding YbaB/EbfC family protein